MIYPDEPEITLFGSGSSGLSWDPMDANPAEHPDVSAAREKRMVAATSVVAAVALTGLKLAVGLLTGSLGILSEAAHSGLDLVAALVTLFAVRVSSRPADSTHPYGHGKVENLSALFETLLLLGTCVWIIVEAGERLFVKDVEVDVSAWAFGVMAFSIVVDYSRSRALGRVARKYGSQALEADALHFSTDIWSSAVVIGGLVLVWIGKQTGAAWMSKFDPLAALGVALIVVFVSYRLGRRTIADLVDEVPPGLCEQVRNALVFPKEVDVSRVRVRKSGPDSFVDVTLDVETCTTVEAGHEMADAAEAAIKRILAGADVVVHVQPKAPGARAGEDTLALKVRSLAFQLCKGAHEIRVHDVMGHRMLEVHLEVSEMLNVEKAHELASEFEARVRELEPMLDRVVTHIEPSRTKDRQRSVCVLAEESISVLVKKLACELDANCRPHDIEVRRIGASLEVSLHCTLDPGTGIVAAHEFTERLERILVEQVPGLGRALIHVEPNPDGPEPEKT